jgi:hypothetical protein
VGGNRWIFPLACALSLALLPVRAIASGCPAFGDTHAPCASQDADWSVLDPDTSALLVPWRDGWDTLDAVDRARLLSNARRWQTLDATARAEFLRRSAIWQALPPTERARRRARYAAWRALPSDEQTRVRAAVTQFAALPVAQQAAWRAQFAAQDADHQRAWLLGPSTGGWIDQARTLFAYVPEGDREATVRMLQALSADVREQLFTLARRLPDDQREQLRRQLLGVDPAQRAVILRQRLSQ